VVVAVKDEDEILTMKLAAKLSSDVLGRVVKVKVLDIIDEERKETHSAIADDVEKYITEANEEKFAKHAKKLKLETELLESCFSPIIQSAGKFNLKVSAQSDEETLQQGVIVAVVGARYKSYCANAARTFIVGEPTKAQEKNYKFLLEVQAEALKTMNAGKAVSGVYARVKEFVAEKRQDLSKHLTKNAGFGLGIDFRESALLLNEKCKENFAENMVFNLAIGFR
jgi:nucleosome binding factor SPN SPT16 subunit